MEKIIKHDLIFFSDNTKKMIKLDSDELSPKNFCELSLPDRLSSFEIKAIIGHSLVAHNEILYLISILSELNRDEHYLVLHYSENGEEVESYLFWDETNWHFSSELINPKIRFKWNRGIIVLH